MAIDEPETIPVEQFASRSDIDPKDLIKKIRAGERVGRIENGKWLVAADGHTASSGANCKRGAWNPSSLIQRRRHI